jgi:hypothetical protein
MLQTVTHIVANDDESFNQGIACHAVSRQEGWKSTVGQKFMEFCGLLIFGLKREP